ncbi:TRAP transporter small permease [Virgibacillus xinjiangensis]|uniref:TRAP transporter small permease n=1 Tax=Virgibacillus xinjiangensis TaxID=393090 RepID=A0ABV7CV92_9BACI
MDKLKQTVDKILLSITSTLLVIMVVLSVWQVLARYVLNVSSPGTEEAIRFLLIWFGLLGAAYVFGIRKHIAILFFREKLSETKQEVLGALTNVIILLTAAVLMVYGGLQTVLLTVSQVAPATGISQAIVYASVPVSGMFIIFYTIYNMAADKKRRKESVTSL